MSDSIDFVPAVRLLNGPKIVSITTEEEKAAVIASGIDELAAQGRHVGASGWSGPGGRSAGSGIALKRFDGVADTESITSLLPKQAAVGGVRRGGAAGGSPAGTSKLPRPVSGPSVHSRVLASDDRADVAVARPGGAPDRRAPVVRASSFHSGPRSGVPTSVSPNLVVGSSEPSSRTPAHGRRATDSKGSSGIASGAGSTGPRAMSAGKSAPETISPTSGRLPKAGRRAVSARTLATDEAPEPSPPQPAPKISASLDPQKAASPFGTVKGRTKFATYYNGGKIPVRIDHFGSGKNRIQWDCPIARVNASELIPVCADGVRETVHPLSFVARQMFKEMMAVPELARQAVPSLLPIARSLKAALSDSDCFEAGMEAVSQLSTGVGAALDPHVADLCSQLAKHALEGKHRAAVWKVLQTLEENGGSEAYPAIKRKVPTYTTVRL